MGQLINDIDKYTSLEIILCIYLSIFHDISFYIDLDTDDYMEYTINKRAERNYNIVYRILNDKNSKYHLYLGDYSDFYEEFIPMMCKYYCLPTFDTQTIPLDILLGGVKIDILHCLFLFKLSNSLDLHNGRTPSQLHSILKASNLNPNNFNDHMKIRSIAIVNGFIRIDGNCDDELYHRCINKHLDVLEEEINKIFRSDEYDHLRLSIKNQIIKRNIKTNGYHMWNHKLEMNISKISNLFMGEQLYGRRIFGFRELFQNSLDACYVRQELNDKSGENRDYLYKPEIVIRFDLHSRQIIIRDNGTGMSEYTLRNYFMDIGSSYYISNDYKNLNLSYRPTGFFGIGFLSCFMLSDNVYVSTSHWQENDEFELHFIKHDRFVTKYKKHKSFSGTEIRLDLESFLMVINEDLALKFNRDKTNINSISCINNLKEYISKTFWNVTMDTNNEDFIICSITTIPFYKFATDLNSSHDSICNIGSNETHHIIDVSKYMIGIEGIITIGNSMLYRQLIQLSGISPLADTVQLINEGKLGIGNEIYNVLPFIEDFYQIVVENDTEKISIISDDVIRTMNWSNKTSFYLFISGFNNLNTNIEMDLPSKYIVEETIKEINDKYLKYGGIPEIFRIYKWCCIIDNNSYFSNHNSTDNSYSESLLQISVLDSNDEISEFVYNNYKTEIPCVIRITNLLPQIVQGFFYENNTLLMDDDYGSSNSKFWLKQTRVQIDNVFPENIGCMYLSVHSIILRFTNEIIKPMASRARLIKSSNELIFDAIKMCVILWMFDEVCSYITRTGNYTSKDVVSFLYKIIHENWNENPLIRSELLPSNDLLSELINKDK
jgi:hypothetical protein